MLSRDDIRPTLRLRKRHVLVFAAVLFSVLGAPTGAYAQAACDASAVDQYVECIPTSDGDNANNEGSAGGGGNGGGNGGGGSVTLPPSVSTQIDSQGGSDAPLLKEVAASPRYGAPTKKLEVPGVGANGKARIGKEQMVQADPQADVSAGDALSAAAGAVQSGDAARLIGLLVALFLVSVATLAAAALRQKRRTAAG